MRKLFFTNTNVLDKQVLKMLLAMDVTANDGLEEEFDLFRTVTKEANRNFNCEEFGITTLFTYLRILIKRLVARLNVNSANVQADISRVVHQFSCHSSASSYMRSSSLG